MLKSIWCFVLFFLIDKGEYYLIIIGVSALVVVLAAALWILIG